jgi:hypothetical protein
MQVTQSAKLANVCYEIRGPVLRQAKQMEAEGQRILKLRGVARPTERSRRRDTCA